MNVTKTQQNYTNYQTQNKNSKTKSNEEFLSALQNFESHKTEETTKTEIKKEEYDEKYQLGLQRYNLLGWFENSFFEKDQNAKNEFVKNLSELSDDDYFAFSAKLWMSFGSGLMEDENGNIISGNHEKNASKEFFSKDSTINYFEDEINKLEKSILGGDPSYMINLLTDIKNFFKKYQSKEQENQYQSLGNLN